ncbi:MAG: prolyl oligopeptidase family serine peptidase [Verrucomicrobia bacterium]|nr:prolyl oligopeptidase family serine peptidase [Verrucomicrobiota bacterium]
MNQHCILAFGLAPLLVFGQATPTVKQAPPRGIRISAADSEQLTSRLESLGQEIETLRITLRNHPDLLTLLPDVQVFHKAVRDAVAYGEFFRPSEIDFAREQLTIGLQRSTELRIAMAPWTAARGSLVRAYRSRIDDSVQPYGLRVPEDWKPEDRQLRPLYLWFHGRNDTLSEVAFIAGQLKGRREFAPTNAFELHLYGRYCNASKFAGEADAFEAMEDVMRHYPIDTNRIAALGFSMGGASAWHMAAHYPGLWAVASAGAGFAETAVYAKVFDEKKEAPPLWEQTLWRLYDATSNSLQTPKLPDWAIVDLRTPPSQKWPGLIVSAGFFDDQWQLSPH